MAMKWVEISDQVEPGRLSALSRALEESGCANAVESIQVDRDGFANVLKDAKTRFDQIRVGGDLRSVAAEFVERMPSSILTLKIADAFVFENRGSWWPRCYFAQGLRRSLVTDIGKLELDGAAMILGSGPEARAGASALARLGFSRFSITDPDTEAARSFIEDLRASHFGVQFQFVPQAQITQLPSTHSITLNTLPLGGDETLASELFYFNFLKPGGIWLDLALTSINAELEAEARAVGAFIASGIRVAAWTDVEWAQEVLGVALDADALSAAYASVVQRPSAEAILPEAEPT